MGPSRYEVSESAPSSSINLSIVLVIANGFILASDGWVGLVAGMQPNIPEVQFPREPSHPYFWLWLVPFSVLIYG
jgi:hypothetical protein